MERYAGRVALVTGASAGVGAAIAQELQRQGLVVVGLARRVDRIKELELKDAPGKLYALQGDLSNEDSILAAFKWIKDNLSGVDILINNAALMVDEDLTSAPTEAWRRQLDVNVLGLSICTREAIQDMLSRGVDDGFVIHISSLAAHMQPLGSDSAMYCATKHALRVLTEGLRKDLVARKSNIRVGQISLGLIRTEFLNHTKNWTPEAFDKFPCLQPEDAAKSVVFMLSQPLRVQVQGALLAMYCTYTAFYMYTNYPDHLTMKKLFSLLVITMAGVAVTGLNYGPAEALYLDDRQLFSGLAAWQLGGSLIVVSLGLAVIFRSWLTPEKEAAVSLCFIIFNMILSALSWTCTWKISLSSK